MSIERFVDAHIHLWDLDHISYGWLKPPFSDESVNGSVEAIAKTYLLDDYFADAHAFRPQACVHIEAGADAAHALKETQWLQAMNDERGFPQAIVAHAPLHDPKVEALLADHCRYKNMRGIRQILNWHSNAYYSYTPRNFLDDPAWEKGFSLLSRYDLSFDLQLYPHQMTQAAKIGAKHDHTPLILNHAGMPIKDSLETQNIWLSGIKALAQLPRASVKISGFGFVDRAWSAKTVRTMVLQLIDAFGIERVMFASDFPTDKLFNRFDQILEAFDEITYDFTALERDLLFAANALRIYRIN